MFEMINHLSVIYPKNIFHRTILTSYYENIIGKSLFFYMDLSFKTTLIICNYLLQIFKEIVK